MSSVFFGLVFHFLMAVACENACNQEEQSKANDYSYYTRRQQDEKEVLELLDKWTKGMCTHAQRSPMKLADLRKEQEHDEQ